MSRGDGHVKRTLIAWALGAGTMLTPLAATADGPAPGEASEASGFSGSTAAYLIAKTAERRSAYDQASRAWRTVLADGPFETRIAERAISNAIDAGDMESAIALSHDIVARGHDSQIAALALVCEMARQDDWAGLFAALSEGGLSVGPLVDGLALGWSALGTGDRDGAEAAFDAVAGTAGLKTFGLMHKAYAMAAAGDDVAAEVIWATGNDGGPLRLSRRSALARIAGLARIGREGAAVAVLDKLFDPAQDAEAASLRAAILRGEPPRAAIADARAGIAETLLAVATALKGEATDGYTLLYTRAAAYLEPGHADVLTLQSQLLGDLGLHAEALASWRAVPEGSGWIKARIGAAESLQALGRQDEAIGLLGQLAASRGADGQVFIALGDALRAAGRLDEAVEAYDVAIAMADVDAVPWRTLFARGVALDRAGQWEAAKADLRRALDAAPEEPNLLRYLGYGMAKRGEAMTEALRLVEAAAEARPDNGRIADSVGWVLHRMGRHRSAVEYLERAVSLLPGDAAANDHLGDGYWSIGREREARFQWRRALAFASDDTDAARLRAKIERGLQPDAMPASEQARLDRHEAPAEIAATIEN